MEYVVDGWAAKFNGSKDRAAVWTAYSRAGVHIGATWRIRQNDLCGSDAGCRYLYCRNKAEER